MTPDNRNTVLTYDAEAFPFHVVIAEAIGCDTLAELRAGLPAGGVGEGASLYRNMEQTSAFRALYEGLEGASGQAFYRLYERFLREVVAPQYGGESIYYQVRPSHRILFADTPGASRFHRDRDYGHHPSEVNYLVPQTAAFATNTLWIESAEGLGDYAPAEMRVGEYLRFDGANLAHGAKNNATGATRVSFDFRVVPEGLADEEIRTSDARASAAERSGNPVRDNARRFRLLRVE